VGVEQGAPGVLQLEPDTQTPPMHMPMPPSGSGQGPVPVHPPVPVEAHNSVASQKHGGKVQPVHD